MKNTVKIALSSTILTLGFGVCQAAFATPTGVYTNVLGGADYLSGSKLSSQTFSTTSANGISTVNNPVGNYNAGAFGYSGRAAVGYFFDNGPRSWTYGLEAGYNYLSPVKSSNTQNETIGNTTYKVNSNATTNAWATDLDFVISQDLTSNLSLIYKFGLGYEDETQNFTSTTAAPYQGAFDGTQNTQNSGFGLDGGLGLKYNFTKNFGVLTEIDGMKGGKNIGYAQGLVGLAFTF